MAELNLRLAACNAVHRYYERTRSADLKVCDRSQLEQELRAVTTQFEKFSVNQDVLVSQAEPRELEAHERLWEQVEQEYNEVCILLNRQLRVLSTLDARSELPPHPESMTTTRMDLRLDPIAIPHFDGSLHNWLAFKDMFETLVHTQDFPEAYKLGKLRQAVNANAVPLIGQMYSGGYNAVWKALKERFDNPKLLAETHVSRFLQIKPATEESAKVLLAIVDTVHESLRALTVMKLPVEHWDALTVPIVISKLPTITQREWSMTGSPIEIPRLSDLLRFLEQRAHSLTTEFVRPSTRSDQHQRLPHHRPIRSHLVTTDDVRCSHCQNQHRTTRCPILLGLRIDQRYDAIRQTGLCFNCLKPGHSLRQCPSSGCRQCGRKHNSLLCRDSRSQGATVGPPPEAQGRELQQHSTTSTQQQRAGGPSAHKSA